MAKPTDPTPSRPTAQVVALPVKTVNPQSTDALLLAAQRRGAWNRANPDATFDEQLAAGAEISERLGI